MHIIVTVKQFGAKKPLMGERRIDLPPVHTLKELLTELVGLEVAAYNAKPEGAVDDSGPLTFIAPLPPLSAGESEDRAAAGKIGFGRRYGRKAELQPAVKTALEAFGDGLFKVFKGDAELAELEAPLALADGDRLTFIRLMFLTGR